METTRRIVLASRPIGEPKPSDFRLEELPVPKPGPGDVLLRTKWLSLDPYMRGRMSDAPSYAKPVDVGGVMEGGTVNEVIASDNERFAAGDIVLGHTGWQTHAVSNGKGLRKLDPSLAPVSTALGVLGMPGMTAYTGLLEIGKPQPGETLVVAAASGAVGALVGQIARIKGARAVGIAGGPKKCAYVKDELGFDDCLDHRAPELAERLKAACPKGIDVYFENVGGSGVRSSFSAPQSIRARAGLRPDFAIQRGVAAGRHPDRAAAHAGDADQEVQHPRLHRQRFCRPPWRLPSGHGGVAEGRPYQISRRRGRRIGAGAAGLHRVAAWRELRQTAGAGCAMNGGPILAKLPGALTIAGQSAAAISLAVAG